MPASALAIPVRLYSPHGSFFSGMWIGGMLALLIWAWDDPPQFIERWRQGRDGERATAKALRKLRPDGWYARHDLADRYGNVDHLAIGPGGVFLLDSKNLWGSFAIENGVLTCHHQTAPLSDYALPKLPQTMTASARRIEQRLKHDLGWIVDVQPVVVLWADFPAARGRIGNVNVVAGDELVPWLRSAPTRICEADREKIRTTLAALPTAT